MNCSGSAALTNQRSNSIHSYLGVLHRYYWDSLLSKYGPDQCCEPFSALQCQSSAQNPFMQAKYYLKDIRRQFPFLNHRQTNLLTYMLHCHIFKAVSIRHMIKHGQYHLPICCITNPQITLRIDNLDLICSISTVMRIQPYYLH